MTAKVMFSSRIPDDVDQAIRARAEQLGQSRGWVVVEMAKNSGVIRQDYPNPSKGDEHDRG